MFPLDCYLVTASYNEGVVGKTQNKLLLVSVQSIIILKGKDIRSYFIALPTATYPFPGLCY